MTRAFIEAASPEGTIIMSSPYLNLAKSYQRTLAQASEVRALHSWMSLVMKSSVVVLHQLADLRQNVLIPAPTRSLKDPSSAKLN